MIKGKQRQLTIMKHDLETEIGDAWESINFLLMKVEEYEQKKTWVENQLQGEVRVSDENGGDRTQEHPDIVTASP